MLLIKNFRSLHKTENHEDVTDKIDAIVKSEKA